MGSDSDLLVCIFKLDVISLTNELIEPCMYAIHGHVNNITTTEKQNALIYSYDTTFRNCPL